MIVTVIAIRDLDGAALGETVFDVADQEGRSQAVSELLNKIYDNTVDPLTVLPFTLKFAKAN